MLGRLAFRLWFALLAVLAGCALAQPAPLAPTALALTPVDANPVLVPGEEGAWDAVSIRFPQVLRHDGVYHMFYASFQSRDVPTAIGYARSEDGLTWVKADANPVLEGDGEGFDAFGVSTPVVAVQGDGSWVMLYSGLLEGEIFGTAVGRATAPSPTGPWERSAGPVLEVGGAGAWDGRFLFPSSLVATDAGWALFYSSGLRLGLATSADGLAWIKYDDPATEGAFAGSDPVLVPGDGWDAGMAWAASVRPVEGGFEGFYYGVRDPNGGLTALGYATSADGVRWHKFAGNPVLSNPGRQTFFPSVVVGEDGSYLVYYASASGTPTEVRLARGTVTRAD